jgi:hypothetical protein
METKTRHSGDTESPNAEERKQDPQGGEEATKLNQQEQDQEQFRLQVEASGTVTIRTRRSRRRM